MNLTTIVVSAILSLSPNLGENRAREVAVPIAAVAPTTEDALLLVVTAFRESSFRKEVETCEVRGDAGLAHTLFQLHVRNLWPHGPEVACSRPVVAAGLALRTLGRGTVEERVSRFMGRKPTNREVQWRVAMTRALEAL